MQIGDLEISEVLHDFVSAELLPGSDVEPDRFWSGLQSVVADLGPPNEELLRRRDELQDQIDDWHRRLGSDQVPGHETFFVIVGTQAIRVWRGDHESRVIDMMVAVDTRDES